MKMSVKKTVVFIAVVIVTCVVSAVMTCIVSGMLAENKEDKMLISLVGEDRADRLESRSYTFSRTYILKDGTVIEGSGGAGNGASRSSPAARTAWGRCGFVIPFENFVLFCFRMLLFVIFGWNISSEII